MRFFQKPRASFSQKKPSSRTVTVSLSFNPRSAQKNRAKTALPKHVTRWPYRSSCRAPLLGFGSLQRLTERGACITRVCLARHVPLSGFLPSQRFSSPLTSRVCFTPERSWDSPFRAFPSERAAAPLDAQCPLAVIASRLPWFWRNQANRLQGLPPSRSPFSRARGLAALVVGALLGFLLSRVSLSVTRPPFGAAPLVRLLPPPPKPLLSLRIVILTYQDNEAL